MSTTEGQALSEIEAYATGLRILVRKEIAATVIGDALHDSDTYYIIDLMHYNSDDFRMWLSKGITNRASKGDCDWSNVARQYGTLYKKIINR